MHVIQVALHYILRLTSHFQKARRRKFPIIAPIKSANTRPPKKTTQVRLLTTFPESVCLERWSFTSKNKVIQNPRQPIMAINVITLTIRPAQVFMSSCSAWLVGFCLPNTFRCLNKFLMISLGSIDNLALLW